MRQLYSIFILSILFLNTVDVFSVNQDSININERAVAENSEVERLPFLERPFLLNKKSPRKGSTFVENSYKSPKVSSFLKKIEVNGYMRFYGFHRNLENPFPVIPSNQFANTPPYVISVGDIYRDPPFLLMNILARPNGRSSIGMDFAFPGVFYGFLDERPTINLNLGINLYGNFRTDVGRFGIQAGGILWTRLSDFTFGAPESDRYSLYERSPWDANKSSVTRAESFYETGAANQDVRFGKQAFKGIIFGGYELPLNFSFNVLFGKSAANADLENITPNFATGGQLKKNFGKNEIGYNTINYVRFIDSLADQAKSTINMHTLSFSWDIKEVMVSGELGLGRQDNNQENTEWGEGIKISVRTPKKYTYLPIELAFFQISPRFTNFFGAFQSEGTFLGEISLQSAPSGIANGVATSFGGSIADVGQLSNNRRGFYINTEFKIRNFKMNIGNMVGTQLERTGNSLLFGHKINALPFSRFVTFSSNVGPYSRWNSFFRGYAQELRITALDTAGLPPNKITFNMLQAQAMQKFTIFNRDLYLFYIASLGSAGDQFSIGPVFSDSAYLRAHYHELDAFYEITNWMSIVLSYGREHIRGNFETNLGDNETGVVGQTGNDPLNQFSWHIGVGLDILVSDAVGVYLRHRRFRERDESFIRDDIKGSETTLEMKIFF